MKNQKHAAAPINSLFRLRRSRGLEPKQVAKMLGQHSTGALSAYEKGRTQPTLKSAVKLMLIYGSGLREMFPELVELCRSEIASTMKKRSVVFPQPQRDRVLERINSCTFEELLDRGEVSKADAAVVHTHVRKLSVKLARL